MPPLHEMRSIQKRTLALLKKAEQDPSKLPEIIREYSIEMEEEDVAYVEKKMQQK